MEANAKIEEAKNRRRHRGKIVQPQNTEDLANLDVTINADLDHGITVDKYETIIENS